MLGECIKNDPAEVYWESTELTSKPSHVWSYYTNKGGRTLETETCSSTVIHFAAFTLTCLLNIPSIYKSQLHVLVTWRHIFICLCVLCSGSGDLLFKLTFFKEATSVKLGIHKSQQALSPHFPEFITANSLQFHST